MITEFGGAVAVPSAVRSSDSTTTIRVNDVIMIRIDGAIESTVNSAISWIARSVTPLLPWPPRLMLMSCASAGPANNPAAIKVTMNRTLRGKGAGLTKTTISTGQAGRPSRLPGYRTRYSAAARLASGVAVPEARTRSAVARGGAWAAAATARGPAAAPPFRQRGDAALLPAAVPSRPGSGRRSAAAARAVPAHGAAAAVSGLPPAGVRAESSIRCAAEARRVAWAHRVVWPHRVAWVRCAA